MSANEGAIINSVMSALHMIDEMNLGREWCLGNRGPRFVCVGTIKGDTGIVAPHWAFNETVESKRAHMIDNPNWTPHRLDLEQNDGSTYKLEPCPAHGTSGYLVYIFEKEEVMQGPVSSWYASEVIPEWMHVAMRLLDVAGAGYPVAGVGKRIGRTYWISKVLQFDQTSDTVNTA